MHKSMLIWISSLLVLLVIGVGFLYLKRPKLNEAKGSFSEIELDRTIQSTTSTRVKKKQKKKGLITDQEIKSFRAATPDKEEIKVEVNKSPHRTPETLIIFADQLGKLIEKAKENIDDATLLINELEECVLNESVALSARALCLTNSEKLAKKYPQLQKEVDHMHEESPIELVNLVEKMKLF